VTARKRIVTVIPAAQPGSDPDHETRFGITDSHNPFTERQIHDVPWRK
jgi:hypothetical protein